MQGKDGGFKSLQSAGHLAVRNSLQASVLSIEKGGEMRKYREWVTKLGDEGAFSGEDMRVNTASTVSLLSLAAEACDLMEEILAELKKGRGE